MPAITTNDLRNGITLQLDNGLFQVVDFQHVKPGKGGAFVRTKLRNVRTGNVLERTFNAGVRVEQAIVDRQDMQFLYRDGDEYVFMNTSTYEQISVPPAALGSAADYLVEQAVAQIAQYQGQIIGVEIPASVELAVAQTEPGVQGDRVSGARKAARLETGKTVQVPLFVETGDRVKVDTRTGEYITGCDGRRPRRRAPDRRRSGWRPTRTGPVPAVRGGDEGDLARRRVGAADRRTGRDDDHRWSGAWPSTGSGSTRRSRPGRPAGRWPGCRCST